MQRVDLPLLLRVFRFAFAALVFIAIASQISTLVGDDPDTDGVTGIVLNAIAIFVCVSLVSAATARVGNTLRCRYFTPPVVPPQTAEQPG